MSFEVGKKVVCIDGNFDITDPEFRLVFQQLPKKGVVYTIREWDSPSVKLEEVLNSEVPMNMGGIVITEEPGFNERRFKPLQDIANEMSTAILNNIDIEKKDYEEYEYLEVEETELT